MLLDFLVNYFKTKSIDNNQSELVNWYLVDDKGKGKYQVVAYPSPGLSAFNSGSGSVVRGCISFQGIAYAVVDNQFYSYTSNGTRTSRGTLNTSTGIVRIAAIYNQINILDGSAGYNYNTGTTTFTEITDVDFIDAATDITAQDGYFLYTKPNSREYFLSDNGDGLAYTSTNFNTVIGDANLLVGLVSSHREIFLLGTDNIEVHFNSGATPVPFERREGILVEWGCAAKNSIAKGDNTFFFLGQKKNGGYTVIRMDGYNAVPISNRGINNQISAMTSKSDAQAYTYSQDSHEFYVLTFPTDGITFTYDMTTDTWHKRESLVSAAYTRHMSNCHMFCYGKNLVGSYNSGTIYEMSNTVYTEAGTAIRRTLVTHPFYNEGKYVFVDRLQTDWETGVGTAPQVTLYKAPDGGHTFTSVSALSLGASSTDYGHRVYWDRLGAERQFVFKLQTTMTDKCILLGAVANIHLGES